MPFRNKTLKFLGNASLVLASLCIALALAEGIARVASALGVSPPPIVTNWKDNPKEPTRFDAEVGWTLKSNFDNGDVTTNDMGFRSRRGSRPTALHRVLLVGDSMVFGHNAPQDVIFSEVLNHRLPDWDFSNVASIGYNNAQEALMIARVWEHIKPEAVVLFYVHGNDQWTNARSDYFYPHVTLSPAGELRFDPASPEHEVPWYRRMTLWRWLDEKILRGKDLIYLAQRIEFAWRKENAYSWRVTEAILRKLADYVGKKGAKLIIVDVPNVGEETVFAGSLAREALLEKLCWSLSVPYYNLRNYYGRNPDSLLVPGDTHWNASGHAFIADRVEEWLAKNGLMTRGTGG